MKITLLVIMIVGLAACSSFNTQDKLDADWNLMNWCSVKDFTQGFFTGTEPDPAVPNSRCVLYFPELLNQVNHTIQNINISMLIPTNFFYVVDNVFTSVVRLNQWMNHCQFGTMFTKLDNTFESIAGLTTAFYKFIMNYANLLVELGRITSHFAQQN